MQIPPFPLPPFECARAKEQQEKQHGHSLESTEREWTKLPNIHIFQGCQNGAFGKRSFCQGDFRHFRRFLGFEEQNPLFLWIECNIRTFANFRQNHLHVFGRGQNDRFPKPKEEGRGTRNGHEASEGSKGISGL